MREGPGPDPVPTRPEPTPPPAGPLFGAPGSPPSEVLVREVLAEAEIKEAAGDLRAAFLACQSLVIDRFGSLDEGQLLALYLMMGRVSLRQGKWERARKYLHKAHSLEPGAAGLAELMSEAEHQSASAPPPPAAVVLEPDDAFETPEEAPAPAVPASAPSPLAPAVPAAAPPPLAPAVPAAAPPPLALVGEGRLVWAAGFWARALAFALDVVLLVGLQLGMIVLGSALLGPGPAEALAALGADPVSLGVVLGLFLGLLFAYLTIFARFGGQTVGKMLLGLRVVRLDGHGLESLQALRRLGGMLLAGLPGLAGFLWVAFDVERRGWHDRVGGTLVVRVRPPRAALAAGEGSGAA